MALPNFDNASSWQVTGTGTITIPAFLVGGDNRLIFVGVGTSAPSADLTSTVVRNAGSAENFTEKWDFIHTAQPGCHCSGHYFTAPVTGSFSITVTLVAGDDECCAGAVSLKDVDQASPVGTHGTAEGHSGGSGITPTSVTVAATADELLIDMTFGFDTGLVVGADQTSRWEQFNIGLFSSGACSTQPGTAVGDIITWAPGGALSEWVTGAVPIRGITGPPPPSPIIAGSVPITQRML